MDKDLVCHHDDRILRLLPADEEKQKESSPSYLHSIMLRPPTCWCLPAVVWAVAVVLADPAFGFSTKPSSIRTQRTAASLNISSKRPFSSPRVVAQQQQREKLQMLPISDARGLDAAASSTIWTAAVEVFDGSTIVDPVVVSDVFWTSLQTKMVTFVLGQVLAAAVFSILLAVFSSQVGKVTGFVTEKFFPTQQAKGLKIPRELRDDKSRVQPDFTKLLICVAIDVVGTSSELVPVLGELTDVVWVSSRIGCLRDDWLCCYVFFFERTHPCFSCV